MKRIFSSLLTLLAISLIACQKDFTIEDDLNPPGQTDSVVLLKKYISLDTTLTAPNDTIFTATYLYDNLNRCSTVLYKYFDHDNAPASEGTAVERRYYNGSDTNMQYRIREEDVVLDPSVYKEYFTYNANAVVIKDSLVEDTDHAVFTYRYASNVIHTVTTFSNVALDTAFYGRKHQLLTNGNITMEQDSLWDYYSASPPALSVLLNVAQFDNHPNPLYRVRAPWPVLWENEHLLQGYLDDQQKNNWLSFTNTFDNGEIERDIYEYIYLPNGYPSVVRIKSSYAGSDYYFKNIYQYY